LIGTLVASVFPAQLTARSAFGAVDPPQAVAAKAIAMKAIPENRIAPPDVR
jgi:hypothetical protein